METNFRRANGVNGERVLGRKKQQHVTPPPPLFKKKKKLFGRDRCSEYPKSLSMAAVSSRLKLSNRDIFILKQCFKKHLSMSTTSSGNTPTILSGKGPTPCRVCDNSLCVSNIQPVKFDLHTVCHKYMK